MSIVGSNDPYKTDRRHRVRMLVLTCVAFVLTVIAGVVSFGITYSTMQDNKRYVRERALEELHSKVRFDLGSSIAGVPAVYGCNAGLPHDVPCPDYTATVVFNGNAENQPPTLTPARDADGTVVIELIADWSPESSWRVVSLKRPNVVAFAVNQTYSDRWSGPIFIPLIPPLYSADGEVGNRIEFYAADTDTKVVGAPLANNRID